MGTYLKLQLKKTLKLCPSVLVITLVMLIGIALTCSVLVRGNMQSEENQKFSIGVVGDVEDTYITALLFALRNMDSSRFAVEFVPMDKAEAAEALKQRKISGYIDVPEDFIKDIYYGVNTPADYVILNGSAGFSTTLIAEITATISELVTEVQNGSYSIYAVADAKNAKEDIYKKADVLTVEYADLILSRDKIYTQKILGMDDGISVGGYYVCGVLMFFMLIWGIACNGILSSRSIALARQLKLAGLGGVRQMVCEYASYLIFTYAMLLILAVCTGLVLPNDGFGISELAATGVFECICFIIGMLPVVVMVTAMQMAFYELVTGTVSRVLVQFLIAVGLGYVSGFFYPNYFFPESVQSFANALPTGVGFAYLRSLISGALTWRALLGTSIYTLVFAAVAVLARNVRMAGDSRL